ncbi:MAG: efflux transporter outer membrane subunit [Verrucomicrobiota bacterium]
MSMSRSVPALAVLMLSGCVVNPPDSRIGEGGSAPGRWTATKQAEAGVDTQWVDRFGDRKLKKLVAESYDSNRDLRAAAARVERSAAFAKGAGAAARPQVTAALNSNRQKQAFVGLPVGGGAGGGGVLSSISESYGSSLNVSWEPDLWGKVRAGEQAALADLEAQGYTYRGARASLAAQVVRAYFLLAEANEQIVLAENALQVRLDTVDLVRGRFEAAVEDGNGSAAQLRLAETDVDTAREELSRRQGERDQAKRQLEILLGRYPAGTVEGAGLPKIPSRPPAGLPSELLLRRPDILTAERRLAAAGKRSKEARLAFYPSFTLTGGAGTTSNELSGIFDSDFGVWSIAGQVAQPILRGGALKSQVEISDAEEREALANLQQTVLNGFGEVEIALAAERYLAERTKSIADAVEHARESALAAERDFALGTGDVLTLLAAQTRRITLASQQVTLRRLRLDNRVNLHLALGGDYKI